MPKFVAHCVTELLLLRHHRNCSLLRSYFILRVTVNLVQLQLAKVIITLRSLLLS